MRPPVLSSCLALAAALCTAFPTAAGAVGVRPVDPTSAPGPLISLSGLPSSAPGKYEPPPAPARPASGVGLRPVDPTSTPTPLHELWRPYPAPAAPAPPAPTTP